MKKLISLTLLVLLGAFQGFAQETPATAKAKKPSVTNTSSESITGKLGYISDKKITVKAKGAEASTTFLIDSETKITFNNEAKLFSDLKKGSVITVAPKAGSVATASLISIKEAAGANAPTPGGTNQE
jgi:hypothetical protein